MKASEAKSIATKFHTDTSTGELAAILAKVKEAASKGKFEVVVGSMHHITQQFLEEEGYKVTEHESQRDIDYTISWQ